jgi:hypothetical protein
VGDVSPSIALRPLLALLVALLLSLAAASIPASAAPPVASPSQAEDDEDECWECEDEEFEEEPGDDFGDDLGDDEELYEGDDVTPLEQATAELGRAKRAAAGTVARLSNNATALRPCTSGGPGWKRIRRVKHAPQRALYAASARRLLADMRLLLDGQQPRIVAYQPAFGRFVSAIEAAPLTDPLLLDAVAAQARRLAAYRDVRAVKASCKVFNKLASRVREFPTRTAAQIVRADYRAAPIARRIERHISSQLTGIDRRHGITHRDAETLADAAGLMVDLGSNQGYATGFQYALSLR